MLIPSMASAVLRNLFVGFFIVAIVTTFAKARRAKMGRRPVSVPYILWGEMLFYFVGLSMAWSGIFHIYFQNIVAPSIGWQPSPFEYELGWFQIGIAVVAMMSLWRRMQFRLAVTIPFVIFSFAAAAQHIDQMTKQHNYSPGNAGPILWFGDLFVPLVILALAVLSRDER